MSGNYLIGVGLLGAGVALLVFVWPRKDGTSRLSTRSNLVFALYPGLIQALLAMGAAELIGTYLSR